MAKHSSKTIKAGMSVYFNRIQNLKEELQQSILKYEARAKLSFKDGNLMDVVIFIAAKEKALDVIDKLEEIQLTPIYNEDVEKEVPDDNK